MFESDTSSRLCCVSNIASCIFVHNTTGGRCVKVTIHVLVCGWCLCRQAVNNRGIDRVGHMSLRLPRAMEMTESANVSLCLLVKFKRKWIIITSTKELMQVAVGDMRASRMAPENQSYKCAFPTKQMCTK